VPKPGRFPPAGEGLFRALEIYQLAPTPDLHLLGIQVDQRVQILIALIRACPDREPSLDEVAQSMNMSPSRLRHIFKAEMGTSPKQFIKLLRLQIAKELLETSFLNVKEITVKIGWRDESHFVKDFKKIYGCSPTRYRIAHLNSETIINRLR
jgi:AraC family transcriptional regulator of arabinose operon